MSDDEINEWDYPLIPGYVSGYPCAKCNSDRSWKDYLKMVRNLDFSLYSEEIPWKIKPDLQKWNDRGHKFNITYEDIKKNSNKFFLVDSANKRAFIKKDIDLFNKWLNTLTKSESKIDLNGRMSQSIRQDMSRYEYTGLDIESYINIFEKEGLKRALSIILHKRTELLKAEIIAHVKDDYGIGEIEWKVHEPVVDDILQNATDYIREKYIYDTTTRSTKREKTRVKTKRRSKSRSKKRSRSKGRSKTRIRTKSRAKSRIRTKTKSRAKSRRRTKRSKSK